MPKLLENRVDNIQGKISEQCQIVANSFFQLSKYFKELERCTKQSENLNINEKEKRNKSLDVIKQSKNVLNYINNNRVSNRGRKPKIIKIPIKKIKIGDLKAFNIKNINEKKEKTKSILINSTPSELSINENPIKSLKPLKQIRKKSNDKQLLKIKRRRNKKNTKIQNLPKRSYNKNPLKGIGYGRILKLNCFDNGKPIIGYKIQIKFYKSNYSLGPFSDELFSLNLKNKLVEEFSNLKCNQDNYEDKARKAISELETIIYKQHKKLSQSKTKSLSQKKNKEKNEESSFHDVFIKNKETNNLLNNNEDNENNQNDLNQIEDMIENNEKIEEKKN